MSDYKTKADAIARKMVRIKTAILEGYGGITPDHHHVDRREHPDARPIEVNRILGIPEPQSVKNT